MNALRIIVFSLTILFFVYAIVGQLFWDYTVPTFSYGALFLVSISSFFLESKLKKQDHS
jgi:hypothetical protein